MSIRIYSIRLSGGITHQHIERLWWSDSVTGDTGDNSRAEIVSWIENQNGHAFVQEAGPRVDVGVVDPDAGPKYLRTYADGNWTNNLLALPRG